MPRANRFFLAGQVWHITHRCHKKELLLKFARDRSNWIRWLFEARRRYGIEILNYSVTSNHIHLLVSGNADRESIPRTLQLVAGSTAQTYNRRKNRKGAFWEDRYHATAVDTDEHLLRCLIYIDLNMVRAGAVKHPDEWPHCGYHEIVRPPRRYRILAREKLKQLLGVSEEELVGHYPGWVGEQIRSGTKRAGEWTEALAVGGAQFVKNIQEKLGHNARFRKFQSVTPGITSELRETVVPYEAHFGGKMGGLSVENGHFSERYSEK